MANPLDPPGASLGEEAAIGRIHQALFGGDAELVKVGRYEIRELIGAGAFGKVYRARDPNLDRDIALKILTTEQVESEAERAELLREARAMAALGHPNVAAVHDAGIVDERGTTRVFIAMELVAGASLRSWLQVPRPLQLVLDVLVQVGRGVSAAHDAGIVHRDLKPDNVLVGDDGRVRVVDFGLARSGTASLAPPDAAPVAEGTPTRGLAGTPAYMAPEQLAGAPASPSTDQFAYCATAWESLHGQRPFSGHSVGELREAMRHPPIVPTKSNVPARVRGVFARGLSAAPEARFASLESLLEVLDARRRSKAPMVIAGVVVVAIAVVGFVLLTRTAPVASAQVCERPVKELEGVWDPAKKAKIESAFAASGLPFKADTIANVTNLLEGAATGWLDAKVAVCEATNVAKTQSQDMMDRRNACLDDVKRQLKATTDAMATGAKSVVERAVRSLTELPSIARCSDSDALLAKTAALPASPEGRKKVEQLSDRLADARRMAMTGDMKAFDVAKEVAADPATEAYSPLAIATALWESDAKTSMGRLAEGSAAARRAFDLAVAAEDKRSAVAAALGMAVVGASDPRKKEDALSWIETARKLTKKLDNANDLVAFLDATEGNIHMTNADTKTAEPVLERAVASIEKLGKNHPAIGGTLTALGLSELMNGRLDEAEPHLREGVARSEAAYGKMHPEVATTLGNLALLEAAKGRFADATKHDDRAIDIITKTYGPDAPLLVTLYGSRGTYRGQRGDRSGADADFVEAMRIAEKLYAANDPQLIPLRLARADNLARDPERKAEALELANKARENVMKVFEGDTTGMPLAFADAVLARALAANGKIPEALPLAKAAADKCKAFPATLPAGPCPLVYQAYGELAIEAAEREQALLQAERAITTGAPDPLRLVEIRVALADSLYNHDKPAGMAVAERGLAAFPRDGDPQLKATLEAWIAKRTP